MAKSLRSKWRRKCRAVKRIRYGQKELERLKKTLGIDDTDTEVKMEQATATTSAGIPKARSPNDDAMETDEKTQRANSITFKDNKSGSYPVWMHQRKIKAIKKGIKRGAKLAKHKKK